jgi:hypothetical protein
VADVRVAVIDLRFLIVLTLPLVLILAACSNDDENENAAQGPPPENVSDDAPDPIPVDADEIRLIDLWEAAGVPHFRDSEVLDFDPHSSEVENGGTLLLEVHGTDDEVIGFYRSALAVLGWELTRVTANDLAAQNETASLFLTVNENPSGRYVLMILTDRLQS